MVDKPMLATDFNKVGKAGIVFPATAQVKLDGFRAIAYRDETGTLQFLTRNGNGLNHLTHIYNTVDEILPDGILLDGELYAHGFSFQQASSWIKRYQADSGRLRYVLFDYVLLNSPLAVQPWSAREVNLIRFRKELTRRQLDIRTDGNPKLIHLCPAKVVNSMNDINAFHDKAIEFKYEGLVIRNGSGLYRFGKRSKDLIKFKKFDDDEFTVVGVRAGKGKFEDKAVFSFSGLYEGSLVHFDATPEGTSESRAYYLKNASRYIGKQLTVKFFGRSDAGIPRFPVVIKIPLFS